MSATLIQLVKRAASTSKPYNCHDAVLLIKALSALRLNRPEVRTVCEKACFSLASSPRETEAPIIVDVVNHLSTLQSSHLPVVRKVLVKRFCELSVHSHQGSSTPSIDPRTAQKAALALLKLGRSASSNAAVEHLLRLLHVLLGQHVEDFGLHMAYVALYTYSPRYTAQPQWWLLPSPVKPSVATLRSSLRFVLNNASAHQHASGNVAWQVLHLLLLLPPLSGKDENLGGLSAERIRDFEVYSNSGALAHAMSAGAYVAFLHTFSSDICRLSPGRSRMLLRGVLTPDSTSKAKRSAAETADRSNAAPHLRRMNVYDVTKLASVVAQVFAAQAQLPKSGAFRYAPDGVAQSVEDDAVNAHCSSFAHANTFADDVIHTVQVSFFVLDQLVVWVQDQQHAAITETTSHSGRSSRDAEVSPDTLAVASILHAYAKSSRFLYAAPDAYDSLDALLRLIPTLTNAAPSLLSWMLASIAALTTSETTQRLAGITSTARLLFHWYARFSLNPKRDMRSDVEALYGCVRAAVNAYNASEKALKRSARPQLVHADRGGDVVDFEAAEGDVLLRNWENEKEQTRSSLEADARIVCVGEVAALMQDVALRLRKGVTDKTRTPHTEDVDMLLAVLLDVYSCAHGVLWESDNRKAERRLFDEALQSLQSAVLTCLEDARETVADHGLGEQVLRTVRLHLLTTLAGNCNLASAESVTRLTRLGLSHLQDLHHSSVAIDSALMLRCLNLHHRVLRMAGPSSHALLDVLCDKFQKYMWECAAAVPLRATVVGEIVRVLHLARQAGVRIVVEDKADGTAGSFLDGERYLNRENTLSLSFPLVLCGTTRLSTHAAAELLQLIAEISPSAATHECQTSDVLQKVTASLVKQLMETPDVGCMVRVLYASNAVNTSQLLFPSKSNVVDLLRCIAAHVTYCLAWPVGEPSDAPHRRRELDASHLLTAVANSQLFVRVSFAELGACGTLREDLLRLSERVEERARLSDRATVLKIRLFCGGIA